MSPQQFEPGIIMIKIIGWLKATEIMTVRAIDRKGSLVRVFVTCKAFLIQAQVGPGLCLNIRIVDKARLMTFIAAKICMQPLKIISGKAVVKVISIETDQLKILAMMITVTFNTLFPINLR